MARYGKRRGGGPPMRLIGIGAAVILVAAVVGVFWLSSKAESNPPAQEEIRVEATNVGAQ